MRLREVKPLTQHQIVVVDFLTGCKVNSVNYFIASIRQELAEICLDFTLPESGLR